MDRRGRDESQGYVVITKQSPTRLYSHAGDCDCVAATVTATISVIIVLLLLLLLFTIHWFLSSDVAGASEASVTSSTELRDRRAGEEEWAQPCPGKEAGGVERRDGDGWTHGWMDRWTEREMEIVHGWIDGQRRDGDAWTYYGQMHVKGCERGGVEEGVWQ